MKLRPTHASAPSSTGLFRYSVVAQVEALVLGGEAVGRAVRAVAARDHVDIAGLPVGVAVRTLQHWRSLWHRGGLPALEPKSRRRTATSDRKVGGLQMSSSPIATPCRLERP